MFSLSKIAQEDCLGKSTGHTIDLAGVKESPETTSDLTLRTGSEDVPEDPLKDCCRVRHGYQARSGS